MHRKYIGSEFKVFEFYIFILEIDTLIGVSVRRYLELRSIKIVIQFLDAIQICAQFQRASAVD